MSMPAVLLEGLKALKATKTFDLALSIGGWAEGSEHFSAVAADPAMRKTFIGSVIKFVEYVCSSPLY